MTELAEAKAFTAAMQLSVDYLASFGLKRPLFAVLQKVPLFTDVLKSDLQLSFKSYEIHINFPSPSVDIHYKVVVVQHGLERTPLTAFVEDVVIRMQPCDGVEPQDRMSFSSSLLDTAPAPAFGQWANWPRQ